MLCLLCCGVSIIKEKNTAFSGDFIWILYHVLLCFADFECQN